VVETGEKRDTRGRRVATAGEAPPRWCRRIMGRADDGGVRAAEGLKYATFAGWVAKASRLVPRNTRSVCGGAGAVRSAPAVPSAPLEVRLADGTSIRGERVAELAALVRALRS